MASESIIQWLSGLVVEIDERLYAKCTIFAEGQDDAEVSELGDFIVFCSIWTRWLNGLLNRPWWEDPETSRPLLAVRETLWSVEVIATCATVDLWGTDKCGLGLGLPNNRCQGG